MWTLFEAPNFDGCLLAAGVSRHSGGGGGGGTSPVILAHRIAIRARVPRRLRACPSQDGGCHAETNGVRIFERVSNPGYS